MPEKQKIKIAIDRGGTFTDCLALVPGQDDIVVKLLSHDPSNYKDAPREGIRRILEMVEGRKIPRDEIIRTDGVEYIRLSTTVATNALLERKGQRHVLITTKGFRDLLKIGNQSRPRIFDLAVSKPEVLYSDVLEIDERVTLVGYTHDHDAEANKIRFDEKGNVVKPYGGTDLPPRDAQGNEADIVQGVSGEAVAILKRPDRDQVKADLQRLYDEGYRSAVIVLMHSYTFPDHERLVAEVAKEVGFEYLSVSSALMPMIKIVPRGTSSTVDAYLTPVLTTYLNGFFSGFDQSLMDGTSGTTVEFMMSDGGLTEVGHFSGLKSIISGPAGGVVGMALTSYDEKDGRAVIGLDMGGTSTDVSRFAGRYEQVFETTLAGVTVQSPQLDVNTVASGGSSCLFWRSGMFVVGPESASAHPGPTCYRKGGPLAITDANLVTGHLAVEMFPRIFGPNEDEGLDEETTRQAFQELTDRINAETGRSMSMDQVAQGFIRVANETMCRPIRALTEARGYAASKHILACFGGAGGQHACALARTLGITTVLIHKYSSILSAYGMALADRVFEAQEPSSEVWGSEGALERVQQRVKALQDKVERELELQGFRGEHVAIEVLLNMRYEGTDTALMTLKPEDSWGVEEVFVQTYKQEFGFTLSGKPLVIDDVRVKGIGKSFSTLGESVHSEHARLEFVEPTDILQKADRRSVYFDAPSEGRVDTPVIGLKELSVGHKVPGPAILIDETQTILVEPKCEARICTSAVLLDVQYDKK